MRKIAFHIQKGGVGKTTLSGNTAHCLSLKNKNVLMVDCDPQGNLSSWYLSTVPAYELADVLSKRAAPDQAIVKLSERLSLIPSFGLNGQLKEYAETKLLNEPLAFQKLCKVLEALGYDYAVFDLSPGMSLLEKNIISAMDEVITPLTPEYFSLDGIEIFNHELQKINENYSRTVQHKRIVLNMVNRSFAQHNIMLEKMQKLNYKLYTIAQDRKIADLQTENKSIFIYPHSKTIAEFSRLTDDIIKGA